MNEEQMKFACKDNFNYLIWVISKSWGRVKQKMLNEFDLTGPQVEMLGAVHTLSLEKKEIKQIDISQLIHIDPMTTSTILRNLEKKKLILRKYSEVDTRARIIELTASGEEILKKAYLKAESIQDFIYKEFDRDQIISDMKLLLDIFERLERNNN
ncbi:MarR family winged helix-turn-helix transcriptional regulator [Parabacteroides sp. Marseille-P3160]|uniref:MarR family winged helix-turn-helix transcriptional regulator n=1 Tax=Parabacteroides sp. Marseille-P3160 TaxID=1917887 RepID=UPI000B41376D|nr:MarR family winged helix-turn-helix transcriptional regulator [Parabacteroides sp. Marseille-P3160]